MRFPSVLLVVWSFLSTVSFGATFTVNQPGDQPDANINDGKADVDVTAPGDQTTLRAAIQEANKQAGSHTITFLGVTLVTPDNNANRLPAITKPVTIDGGTTRVDIHSSGTVSSSFTLELAGGNSVLRGLAIDEVLLRTNGDNRIEDCYVGLDAAGTTPRRRKGVVIDGCSNNIIGGASPELRNIISGNAVNFYTQGSTGGVLITGAAATGNRLIGNYIGTDVTGMSAIGQGVNSSCVTLYEAPDNFIGGTSEAERNVISGNADATGIVITGAAATRNVVRGNYIGVNVNGTAALNNAIGLFITAPGNTIGGNDAAARNVISGSTNQGIVLSGSTASGNIVSANYLGVDATGNAAIRNNQGVRIDGAPQNVIGGRTPGERNVISGNGFGISISGSGAVGNRIEGNYIGPKADGGALGNESSGLFIGSSDNTIGGIEAGAANVIAYSREFRGVHIPAGTGNAILGNSIFDNKELGIDLGGGGVEDNDPGDTDTGANNLQNFPELKANDTGGIDGQLESEPNKSYRIEFFSVPEKHTSAHGEGKTFISSANVTTDANGLAIFPVPGGEGFISATATEIVGGVPKNTSEFSLAVKGGGGPPPTGLVVDSLGDEEDADPGDGRSQTALGTSTLRSAIEEANATKKGKQKISFNLPGPLLTIAPASPLPEIRQPAVIDGSTQPGFAGTPLIQIDGINAGAGAIGFRVVGGDSTLRGLAVNRFDGIGIELAKEGRDVVAGCAVAGCRVAIGVRSAANQIGGLVIADRNVITGNGSLGIAVVGGAAKRNRIIGNLITANGGNVEPPPRNAGVVIASASNNTIGGLEPGSRNIISGNPRAGIYMAGKGAEKNAVQGNFIGLDEAGTTASKNQHGVIIDDEASRNTIGGLEEAARNIISGNENGVLLTGRAQRNDVVGNYIGTDVTGTRAVANFVGVALESVTKNRVGMAVPGGRNIISGNTNGVRVTKSVLNYIRGNYIGTKPDGLSQVNEDPFSHGIDISNSERTIVGGRRPGEGNLISGLQHGVSVSIDARKTIVQGNLIGTDASGDLAVPNRGEGIKVFDASETKIGGFKEGEGNVVSGNRLGIDLSASSTAAQLGGSVVQGNQIGVGKSGGPLGNDLAGVRLFAGATGNLIGSTNANGANVIAFNGTNPSQFDFGGGVLVHEAAGAGNAILGNIITSNSGLGIDLAESGAQTNDPGDGDAKPSGLELQNYPVLESALTSATADRTLISGALNSARGKRFRLEFFANTSGDATAHGEGEQFLGSVQVATDGSGDKSFVAAFNRAVDSGALISATATEIVGKKDEPRGTSEFSANIVAAAFGGARARAQSPLQPRGEIRFLEADGDRVEVRAAKDVLVRFEGEREPRLVAVGANAARSVSIKVERGSRGDGFARLGGIEVLGELRSIIAPNVDIAGDGIRVSGALRTLIVHDVLDGADVLLGGSAADRTAIGVRAIGDGTLLQSGSTIELLGALRIGASEIVAPAVETLRVRETFDGELNVPGESRIWIGGRRKR